MDKKDGVRAANARKNARMKAEGKGLFAPGVAERGRAIGARAGGLAHAKRKTGVCAPGMAAKGWKAAGLDKIWDDPVYREMMRWRRSPWKAKKSGGSNP